MKILTLFLGILSALIGCSDQTAGNTTETTNSVSATLKDEKGKLLKNTPVYLRLIDSTQKDTKFIETSTDNSGKFTQELPTGQWTIEAYNTDSSKAVILKKKIKKSQNLGVLNLQPTININGVVIDTLVKWEIVQLLENNRSVLISKSGEFEFKKLPRGIYEISISGNKQVEKDTIDLTYAPVEFILDWKPGEKANLRSIDSVKSDIRAYWSFDSSSVDKGPNSIDASWAGNIEYVGGVRNQGAKFISATHLHFGPKKPLLEVVENQDFGFSFWIKIQKDEFQTTFGLLNMQPSGPGQYGFDLFLDAERELVSLLQVSYNGLPDTLVTTTFPFNYGKWHHVALYRQGNLYGVELDRNNFAQRFAQNAESYEGSWLIIGADHLFKYFYKNTLDELYFYEGAPSGDQLDSLFDLKK